jgi:ABC-type Mn2+/Zn2+ transport system ATPase subunit
MTLLEIRAARLGYGGKAVLDGVSLDVRRGNLVGIVGPNGAGKTTLLKAILGTLDPLAGYVAWPVGRPRLGYVPQREDLDPVWPLSALDVVLAGRVALRGAFRRWTPADRAAARAALADAGIGDLADAHVGELSGGQARRALIARALAARPDLLVLDEPMAGLDLAGRASILGLVRRLHRDRDITVVVASHDLNAVASIATRLALLHEGRLREGGVDAILSPAVLGEVYGLDVAVGDVAGRRVVTAGPRR